MQPLHNQAEGSGCHSERFTLCLFLRGAFSQDVIAHAGDIEKEAVPTGSWRGFRLLLRIHGITSHHAAALLYPNQVVFSPEVIHQMPTSVST
jgi:hypothetical protein